MSFGPNMSSAPFKVRALFEYSSTHDDDLQFGIGQLITVTDVDDDDWYGGEYVDDSGTKHQGIFPRNFVEKYEPTAPPRPTRNRTKRDSVAELAATEPVSPPPPFETPSAYSEEPGSYIDEVVELEASPPAVQPSQPKSVEPPAVPQQLAPVPPPPAPRVPIATPSSIAALARPASYSKSIPPPTTSEKPASGSVSSTFRDRIAAFNKQAAPPLAPFKPVGLGSSGSDFIKKPFVAPPPSRNAYVPPPREVPTTKIYRRDEDPEIKEIQADNLELAEKAGLIPSPLTEGGGDDLPKPTTLKERIALLQKQQLEVAQRHAEAVAKKEKPKKSPKKRSGSIDQPDDAPESELPAALADLDEAGGKTSVDEHRPPAPLPPRRKSSKGAHPEAVHDGNEADMSGAGDTTEGQDDIAEKDDSDVPRPAPLETPIRQDDEEDPGEQEGSKRDDDNDNEEEDEEEEGEEEEEAEEDDVDPEIRRREELRARMAKISGMGMPGMFGLVPMPTAAATAPQPRKTKRPTLPQVEPGDKAEQLPLPASRAPPVPTMMAFPGMSQPKQQRPLDETLPREPRDPVETRPPPPPPPPARASVDHYRAEADYEEDLEEHQPEGILQP